MKSLRTVALAGISGALIAGALVNPVFAAQPRGSVKKYVQNQTTNSARADADTAGEALQVRANDILKFTIDVINNGDSDMHFTQLTDTLPPGVALVSNPTTRQISEELGVVRAGQTITKTYLVKVTAENQGNVIENKACFTGNDKDKKAAQNGCNSAVIKVTGASAPGQPKPAPQPTKPEEKKPEHARPTPTKPEQPQATPAPEGKQDGKLPTTGPSEVIASTLAVGAGAAGYAGRLYALKRRK